MTFTITEEWLDRYLPNVDLDDFMDALAAAGIDPDPQLDDDGNYYWTFTAADENGNGVPDFLDSLVEDPIVTNPSQGGILG